MPRLALGLIVALVMALGMCPAVGLADEVEVVVQGEEDVVDVDVLTVQDVDVKSVDYLDENGEKQTAQDVSALTGTTWGTEGQTTWRYVASGITKEYSGTERIKVIGDMHLILEDDSKLEVTCGIQVESGGSLTIYAQSTSGNMGKAIISFGGDNGAGIDCQRSNVTINGGDVKATGPNQGILEGVMVPKPAT